MVYYLAVIKVSFLFLTLSSVAATALGAPERIVSINQCADELLLNLADRRQIRSVTHYVKDPATSWDAELAEGIPGNGSRVEEVLAHDPDLVLVGDFTTQATVNLLVELGMEVMVIPHAKSLADVYRETARLADKVGHPERGQAMIERMKRTIEYSPTGAPVRAVVYQPNGFTTGPNSLVDEVMSAAGLYNIAREVQQSEYGYFPLERLLWGNPELLILDPQTPTSPALANQVLEHPALRGHFQSVATVTIPPQAWACGSQHVAQAVELLRASADRLRERS